MSKELVNECLSLRVMINAKCHEIEMKKNEIARLKFRIRILLVLLLGVSVITTLGLVEVL